MTSALTSSGRSLGLLSSIFICGLQVLVCARMSGADRALFVGSGIQSTKPFEIPLLETPGNCLRIASVPLINNVRTCLEAAEVPAIAIAQHLFTRLDSRHASIAGIRFPSSLVNAHIVDMGRCCRVSAKAIRVNPPQWVVHISVRQSTANQSYGVRADITSGLRLIVSVPVVTEPALLVIPLALKSDITIRLAIA